jgi:hypothetical protein
MADNNDTPLRAGTQGWRQFLVAKKEMLNRFDRAKEYAEIHEIETYHGIVAEEEFRSWLSNFLPKKYGVTSGYVISQGQPDSVKAPHFDVIIYDHLNSPILWEEDHSGLSPSGRSQAIPAEYVLAVIEVKSRFTSTTAKKGLEHLIDLEPLYRSVDDPKEHCKLFLPHDFVCGLVFFELVVGDEYSKAALNNMTTKNNPRGYFGGIVLRGEGLAEDCSGRILPLEGDTAIESTVGKLKGSLLNAMPFGDSMECGEKHLCPMLNWNAANFSMFAHDLICMLAGTFQPGYISSWHGMNWRNTKRSK